MAKKKLSLQRDRARVGPPKSMPEKLELKPVQKKDKVEITLKIKHLKIIFSFVITRSGPYRWGGGHLQKEGRI